LLDYHEAEEIFDRLAKLYPKSELADDALTEVGWYYLFVAGNKPRARKFFERVTTEYARKNAADNALFWTAQSYYEERNFAKSLRVHERLVRNFPLGRLARYSRNYINCLQPVVSSFKKRRFVDGVVLDPAAIVPGGVYVAIVRQDSGAAKAGLLGGDLIESVNSKAVSTKDDFSQALEEAPSGQVTLEIQRGQARVSLHVAVTTDAHYERVPHCH
jgi:tetratricopeptide (TPR) repeat protein